VLSQNTVTVMAIAACGVTLALATSVGLQPRLVMPIAVVAPMVQETLPPKIGARQIPHKFMRTIATAP
jgi:uncharacterized protein YqfA (UPF0365 family)